MGREEELLKIPPRKADPSKWPPEVRSIGMDEADAFGIDAAGTLYWHGKPVEIRRPLELSGWQSALGGAAAISGVSLAIFDALRFFGLGS